MSGIELHICPKSSLMLDILLAESAVQRVLRNETVGRRCLIIRCEHGNAGWPEYKYLELE
jgi:hypothetical protein